MIDHVKLWVSDIERSKAFYEQALAPVGYSVLFEFPGVAGLGRERPDLWLAQGESPTTAHLALRADDRSAVDAFHDAALAAGGTDNGTAGLRPEYHEHYYGAFVLDPDGNNLEAVCHEPG
jgi:catechol 2,3-dioxygenase-like lactoylglutathione lyase family enzyme